MFEISILGKFLGRWYCFPHQTWLEVWNTDYFIIYKYLCICIIELRYLIFKNENRDIGYIICKLYWLLISF